MKRILLSLVLMAGVAAMVTLSTRAIFTDTEEVNGNTFAAGSLDLEVSGDPEELEVKFSGDDLVPGKTFNAGTITLRNAGSIDGKLTVAISNPVSNENSLLEPETSDGDIVNQQIDPTGYDKNGGDGELWDMARIQMYFDLNGNGTYQSGVEPIIVDAVHLDMTSGSGFHLPLNTNLWSPNHGFDGVLGSTEEVKLGLLVTIKTDAQLISQPQYNGLTNNMAMTDDMVFDLVLGLEQVTP